MNNNRPIPKAAHRGVTLVETVLSVMILGGALIALLNAVGASRVAQAVAGQRQTGLVLAEDLMAEVLAMDQYKEGGTLGPDSGENTGNRSQFDDIDDYHGWSSTPPTDKDGTAIAGADGYTREVTVEWRDPLTPSTPWVIESGTKIITVTVKRGDRVVAELNAFRTDNWVAPQENY